MSTRVLAAVAAVAVSVLASCTGTVEDPYIPGISSTGGVASNTGGASVTSGGVAAATGGAPASSGGSTSVITAGAGSGGQATTAGSPGTAGTTSTTGGASSGGSANAGAGGGNTSGGSATAGAGGGSSCANGQLSCAGSCVDTRTNASHCGACGTVCQSGSSCVNGACACPSGRSACGTACVDLMSDAANCGTCGTACGMGRSCQQGMCQCASGQTACGASCANLMTDAQNCGVCGTVCPTGQACAAGRCSTGGGGPVADGCMGLAQNLTLSQIAVYQTVKIPIMQNGMEVAVSARKAGIVAARDAVFRLFVTPGSGFTARELSGRVFVDNEGTVDAYFAKKTISATSAEATLDSTFVVTVPKDKITRTTRYYAEVAECGTGSGTMQTPRFPASDALALGAREVGVLKIRLIPINVNSMQPDLSETGMAPYKALLQAMYPITNVEFTTGAVLNSSSATNWTGMLDQLRARRQSDAPAADIYYYGMMKPTATLREFCGGGCTAGIGYVPQGSGTQQASQRVSMGLAFADATSADTMAHEIGHNHGRNHAPCVSGGSISGVDGNYPHSGGAIGVWGWDNRTSRLVATDRTDIMGYCNNKWISDYTYQGILTRLATVNGAPPNVLIPSELIRPWRVLLLEAQGATNWGVPIDEPVAPAGVAEGAEVLDDSGQVIATVTVYRTEISDIGAFSFEIPVPEPGWHSVRVAGGAALAY